MIKINIYLWGLKTSAYPTREVRMTGATTSQRKARERDMRTRVRPPFACTNRCELEGKNDNRCRSDARLKFAALLLNPMLAARSRAAPKQCLDLLSLLLC